MYLQRSIIANRADEEIIIYETMIWNDQWYILMASGYINGGSRVAKIRAYYQWYGY